MRERFTCFGRRFYPRDGVAPGEQKLTADEEGRTSSPRFRQSKRSKNGFRFYGFIGFRVNNSPRHATE